MLRLRPAPSKPSTKKKLSPWKLLDEFRRRLAKVMESVEPGQKPPGGPERLLLEENYFSLILFGLFKTVLTLT